jgi:arylsulfatase A-like enzyme
MRRTVLVSVAVALAVLLLSGVWGSAAREARALTTRPNIVFILADDMRKDDLRYMPKTRNLLRDKGMSFSNAFVSHALCCPARATIMRGQYAHNTGVWTNSGSSGGLQAYRANGLEQDNVTTRLDVAGYRTGLFGKYLNGYNAAYVPPGWDRWFATWGDYFRYDVNDQGTIKHFGADASDYKTDVLRRETEAFIGTSTAQGKPFFAYVAPKAPHNADELGKPVPAPRDRHTYDGLKAKRPPSFNEKNVSDKPPWIRQLPILGDAKKAEIDDRHEKRAESLQAVDDLVAGVVGKLKDKGVLGNTYIFFTSDNGWQEGEHRLDFGKWRPYEEDVRVPLLVRGPGVAAGRQTQRLTLNTDYLPTFTHLAGAQRPGYTDGRSLRPVLEGTVGSWRTAVLLEAARNDVNFPNAPAYRGIRESGGAKYVEYAGGKRELYHLGRDPYELNNRYPATKPSAGLVSRLQALKTCAADSCRAAENGQ